MSGPHGRARSPPGRTPSPEPLPRPKARPPPTASRTRDLYRESAVNQDERRAYTKREWLSHKTARYCWSTPFKVLGVLFLGEVYSAFLPSKKTCWAHQFRYLGVAQQYPANIRDFTIRDCWL